MGVGARPFNLVISARIPAASLPSRRENVARKIQDEPLGARHFLHQAFAKGAALAAA
jgi:hypothetical protein